MTEGFDNTIASEEEAERLARGKDDIQPGPDESSDEANAQEESTDAADTMVNDQADSDPAPK